MELYRGKKLRSTRYPPSQKVCFSPNERTLSPALESMISINFVTQSTVRTIQFFFQYQFQFQFISYLFKFYFKTFISMKTLDKSLETTFVDKKALYLSDFVFLEFSYQVVRKTRKLNANSFVL